jgi:hypothetical protein
LKRLSKCRLVGQVFIFSGVPMRSLVLLAVMTTLVVVVNVRAGGDSSAKQLSFEKGKVGETPAGWQAGIGGSGAKESVWKLVEDKTAPGGPLVLFQTLYNPRPALNFCFATEAGKYKDVDFSVAIKAFGGKGDQGGGPAWRAKDTQNFYVARMSPGVKNLWLFKTRKGERVSIQKQDIPTATNNWHTMRVVHQGEKIQCYFDGKLTIEANDNELADAGLLGLWTKGDSQTYFADLKIVGKKE